MDERRTLNRSTNPQQAVLSTADSQRQREANPARALKMHEARVLAGLK